VADFSQLPLRYRAFLAAYRWRRVDPIPWTRPRDARDATVALITSAGVLRPGIDEPFVRRRGGDPSFRFIPHDTQVETLVVGQTSTEFDPAPSAADRNLAMPLDRLRALARSSEVGRIAPRHLSFNGSLTAPGRLVTHTAPAAVEGLRADGVDLALLVPF
jgi:D-proline reductase (dithiol) PrdB